MGASRLMDVYLLIDPTLPPEVSVVSVHARHQGADLAAIEYAQKHSRIEQPFALDRTQAVQTVYSRLCIINRDLRDEDSD